MEQARQSVLLPAGGGLKKPKNILDTSERIGNIKPYG